MSEHSGGGFVVFLSPSCQSWDSTVSTRPHHSKFFQLHHSPVIDYQHDMMCDMLPTASQKCTAIKMHIKIIFSMKCQVSAFSGGV
jgi:hypothetical protein